MIKVKPQATRQLEQKLSKKKEGPEWGALTPPHFGADGLVVTESDSDQCVVLGRRSADTNECQPRRTA